MKTMDMAIVKDGINWQDERKGMDEVEVTVAMIKDVTLAYASTSKQFKEDDRRQYYKVCDKMDALVKARKEEGSKETTIEFEDAEMGFIKKIFRENTGLLPTDYVRRVEEKVWAVQDR